MAPDISQRWPQRLLVAFAAFAVGLMMATGTPSIARAAPAPHKCSPFVLSTHGTKYRWFHVTVSHGSCQLAKRVLSGFFDGAAKQAGPYPSDGDRVYGWLCKTGPGVPTGTPATCRRGAARIRADWT